MATSKLVVEDGMQRLYESVDAWLKEEKDIKIRIPPDFKQTLKVCPIELRKKTATMYLMINHEYEVAVFFMYNVLVCDDEKDIVSALQIYLKK